MPMQANTRLILQWNGGSLGERGSILGKLIRQTALLPFRPGEYKQFEGRFPHCARPGKPCFYNEVRQNLSRKPLVQVYAASHFAMMSLFISCFGDRYRDGFSG